MSKINGPGAALRFHLELFEDVDDAWQSSKRLFTFDDEGGTMAPLFNGRPRRVNPAATHRVFQQRARLATASGAPFEDGDSVSERKDVPGAELQPDNVLKALSSLGTERVMLNEGETHYVSHHIAETLWQAVENLEPEPLFPTDLPAKHGLIVFEYPQLVDDLHPDTGEVVPGLHVPIRAIGWAELEDGVGIPNESGDLVRTDGIMYFMYVDVDSWEEHYCTAYKELIGDLPEDLIDAAHVQRHWLSDSSGWAYGLSWGSASNHEWSRKLPDHVARRRKWLLAYFRWTWQRLIQSDLYSPNRAERRMAARMKRPLQDGNIKVMHLRRIERNYEHDPEFKGALDHRFIVRLHKRRQHYPSLGPARLPDGSFNPDSHRIVWIMPYIKGPESGPLIVGHNVSVSVR